ncbi:MAG: hypothetical protein J3Q66DRAFT_439646 [Benniella sp.]|nr:MAG: hypothetical protein J3Q66DRAFT_439646 [Benniella sp.]
MAVILELRESESAEAKITFVGEAPSSWSYVRREAANERQDKHEKRPKVLEKRTVEDIQDHKYSLIISAEGSIVPEWI